MKEENDFEVVLGQSLRILFSSKVKPLIDGKAICYCLRIYTAKIANKKGANLCWLTL